MYTQIFIAYTMYVNTFNTLCVTCRNTCTHTHTDTRNYTNFVRHIYIHIYEYIYIYTIHDCKIKLQTTKKTRRVQQSGMTAS